MLKRIYFYNINFFEGNSIELRVYFRLLCMGSIIKFKRNSQTCKLNNLKIIIISLRELKIDKKVINK